MSTSIINTGGNTKIFSTNNVNKIEVSTENIIQSDSDSREVVKKGYLLSQINLTTIPDIIQDAINEAMLDIKEQTLADALIETLRLSISNLDDGVYKKTYIDNTISYIENLVVSKVSPETVAAIADSKLAIALEGFATTSSVSILSSRVENSEVEISNVKQTINTKDAARALQFEQMEARVNDTFAGYSDAIDLYVDAQGNVKSQKIETLTTNIGLQLQEINKLIVDTDNNWNAKSVKLITSPTGVITGYSFQDGSGLKSNFDINADNFKISNSYNTYSPFSIVGTSLYFNGKVTFSNVTGTDNLAYKDMSNVTTIDGGKITANSIGVNQIDANAISGKTISGGIITGASIFGVQIEGSVIKASFIDLTSTATLTNWQQYTPSNYPSAYNSNFAHKNDGNLLVDSLGYVRLMGNTNIVTTAVFSSVSSQTYGYHSLTPYSIDYYSYNDYKSSNINRCITSNPILNIYASKKINYLYLLSYTKYNTTHNCFASFYVHDDIYEISASVSQGSSAGTESSSGNIKKNGVIIKSFSNIHGNTNLEEINISGGIPITISVGCTLGYFGGMACSISVQSTNTLSTSTQVSYSNAYNAPFKLLQGYTEYGATNHAEVDVPAITINTY